MRSGRRRGRPVIERIEADPEFQRQKAEMVRHASQLTVPTGDPQQDADRREPPIFVRSVTYLPNELLGVGTEYKNSPGRRAGRGSPDDANAAPRSLRQGGVGHNRAQIRNGEDRWHVSGAGSRAQFFPALSHGWQLRFQRTGV